jgi:hypothetical protein
MTKKDNKINDLEKNIFSILHDKCLPNTKELLRKGEKHHKNPMKNGQRSQINISS